MNEIKLSLEDLPDVIVKDLKEYTEEKSKAIDKAVRKRTENARKGIIEQSPVRKDGIPQSGVILIHGVAKDNYQPGAYKKGWIKHISTKQENRTQGYVRNKTNWQLVHLLEFGHKDAHTGKMIAPSPASGHVNPVEEKERKGLAEDIEHILEED